MVGQARWPPLGLGLAVVIEKKVSWTRLTMGDEQFRPAAWGPAARLETS